MTGLRFRFDPARMSGEQVSLQAETAVAPVDAMSQGRRVVEDEPVESAEVADDETSAGDTPEITGDVDSEPSDESDGVSTPDTPDGAQDQPENESEGAGEESEGEGDEPADTPASIDIPEGADIEAMSAVELKAILDANEIAYDGRWGADKLRTLLVPAETTE